MAAAAAIASEGGRTFVIGSRTSDLAMAQTRHIQALLMVRAPTIARPALDRSDGLHIPAGTLP